MKCIEDEIPFDLPDGWAWSRLLSIIEEKPTNGYSPKGVEYITNVRNLTLTATTSGFFKPNEFKYVDVKIAPDSKYWLKHNDILIQRSNSRELVGTSCIYDDKDAAFIYPDLMMKIHLMSSIDVRYIDSVLKSTLTREYYITNATGSAGSMPKINQSIVANTLVSLPPYAEQKLLVRYLDEVMNITNSIESGKLDIFELVSKAKSKILNLAIRGQLVQQNPNDEPASVLLERIRAEKEVLIKAGKIKRDKKESVIFRGEDNSYYLLTSDNKSYDADVPFDIPDSWCWARLKDVFIINPRNKLDDELDVSFVPMPLIDDGYSGKHTAEKRRWKEVKTGFTHFAEGDVGVAKITPCFENRKSTVFENLANGYGAGTTELHILRPYSNTILAQYLLAYVKSDYFVENGKQAFTGAVGQQRIGKEYVEGAYFPLPPIQEQERIIQQLNTVFEYLNTISDALS